MSIAVRIESINNNLKNAYESLDGLGIDLTNTDKNLENLSSKIDILYNELPKTTEEGTEITLNDTKKAKMKMILKGNTSQISTTGKNLLKNELISSIVQNVTFTNNNNGSIKVNGIASGILNKKIGSISIKNGETYIISGLPFDSNDSIRIDARPYGVSNQIYNNWTSVNGSYTATEDATVDIHIRVANGYNCNNIIVWPQVEKGTEATEYESYTGKEPSPNPDYPQDIHVVTGDNTIEIIGKNKIPTQKNMWESGHYDINGNKGAYASRMRLINLLKIKPNTTYKIKNKALIIRAFDINQTFLRDIGLKTPDSTFTTSEDCYYLAISTDITYTDYNETSNKLSLFLNSETNMSWEQYHYISYPINLGSLELCKIGNYQDYLYKENGNWYKYEAIDKKILTNSSRKLN